MGFHELSRESVDILLAVSYNKHMLRRIPESVLNQAKACEKRHVCTICEADDLCKIKFHAESGGTHFVQCEQEQECVFLERYENDLAVCNCPARKFIYQLYRE